MLEKLHLPERYRAQLEYLHRKHGSGARLHALTHEGVPLLRYVADKRAVSKELASAVARGRYATSPARVRRVRLDKERDLFSFNATDFVLHGVVATLLSEAMQPHLSPRLYSYQKGRSSWTALRDLAAFTRRHRKERHSPLDCGLFVLRADVESYGDSIPFAGWSPIWAQLRELLGGRGLEDPTWRLLTELLRPRVAGDDGERTTCVGVATGSPIATVLTNLYLDPLDHQMESVAGGCYARFGDDLFFAHPDYRTFKDSVARIEAAVAERHLRLNTGKQRILFFNGAGRRADAAPELPGATDVEYLGCRLAFDGTVGLSRKKSAQFLDDLRARIKRTGRMLRAAPPGERGPALCAAVNRSLDPSSPLASAYAPLLAYAVTDRGQLKQLDYWIAREIARALSGRRSARAFRDIPYRTLRRDWKLLSLVAQRNRQGAG